MNPKTARTFTRRRRRLTPHTTKYNADNVTNEKMTCLRAVLSGYHAVKRQGLKMMGYERQQFVTTMTKWTITYNQKTSDTATKKQIRDEKDPPEKEKEPDPLLVTTCKGTEQIGWTTSKRLLGPQMVADHSLGTDFDMQERIKAATARFFARKQFYFSRHLTAKTKGMMLRTYVLPALLHGSHAWLMTEKRMRKLTQAWRWFCRMTMNKPNRYLMLTKEKYYHWQLQHKMNIQPIRVYWMRRLVQGVGHLARRSEEIPGWRMLFGGVVGRGGKIEGKHAESVCNGITMKGTIKRALENMTHWEYQTTT